MNCVLRGAVHEMILCPHLFHTSAKEAGRAAYVELTIKNGMTCVVILGLLQAIVPCSFSFGDLPQVLALQAKNNCFCTRGTCSPTLHLLKWIDTRICFTMLVELADTES